MSRPELPTGTVTFLFTDIEGSTKLLQELGDAAYGEAVEEHRRILREAFAANGGVEVDTAGDGFFVAFPTAPQAIEAAAAAQAGLADQPIRVRVGLHSGAPLVSADGYVGADVHRAARIAAAGHGGQVVLSASTAALVGPAGLTDLGEHRLKDLSAPERLYQLGDGDFPPLKSFQRTNLPTPSTPFVGRERALGDLSDLLAQDVVRLLTLTGTGGTGKTRLALRAAGEAAFDYPDGVFWVPLADVRDPALVPASIAQALATTDEETLTERIGERRILLVLDNCEHLLAAASALSELLSACPNLNVLATSREPLHLAGEREYLVPTLADEEALELFRQRAHASEPEQVVLAICRRLDCLPLAVELAAARTKLLSPEALLERLERRLPLLTGGPRDAPERQRTLEATIAWSYDLLNESEQRLLMNLSVFAGGFPLEAADEVCEADLDTLQSLVDKNLLRREGERFGMLATIREYATEQLAQAGETEEYERRHARHFRERAGELYDQRSFLAPDRNRRDAAGAWFTAERENLRAAFAFFRALDDRQAQLDLAGAAQEIWTAGRVAEGRRVLAELLGRTTEEGLQARWRALMTASWLAWLQGDYEEALRLAEEALALARSAGDPYCVAVALFAVQASAGESGDLRRASAAVREGEQRARELELKQIEAYFMNGRASLEAKRGNFKVAREVFREALSLNAASGGSRRQRVLILLNLGLIAVEEEELSKASALLDEAVDLAREVGPPDAYAGVAVEGLAAVAVGGGEPSLAARLLGAAHAWHQLDNIRLVEWEQRIHDRTLAAAQAQLSADDFTSAFRAGTKLTLDEAVEYARTKNLVQAVRR